MLFYLAASLSQKMPYTLVSSNVYGKSVYFQNIYFRHPPRHISGIVRLQAGKRTYSIRSPAISIQFRHTPENIADALDAYD